MSSSLPVEREVKQGRNAYQVVSKPNNKHEGYSMGWAGGRSCCCCFSRELGRLQRPRTPLDSWRRRGRSADASRARAEACPPKTKGLAGATRLFTDRVERAVCLGPWFWEAPAERRPAGVLDDVLRPLNLGIPGIRPCPTKGAPVCHTAVLIQPSRGGHCCCCFCCPCWQGGCSDDRVEGIGCFRFLSAKIRLYLPKREHKYMLGVKNTPIIYLCVADHVSR